MKVSMINYLLTMTAISSTSSMDVPCRPRHMSTGNIVCVCNRDYCDTVLPPKILDSNQFVMYTSSKKGLRFKKYIGNMERKLSIPDSIVDVDPNIKYQTIHGWGGTFTDAYGIVASTLSFATKKHLQRSYFSTYGIEYTLCRVAMGSTDSSLRQYTYNDGPEDKLLINFSLAPEDYEFKLPFMQEAIALSKGALKFFASVWAAPKWMKTNGEYNGFGYLKKDMYQVWSNYFLKFLDMYKEEGVKFWGITTQNEPTLIVSPLPISTVGWTSGEMSKWVAENLGPTLRSSQHSEIKIICVDDQRFYLPWLVDQIFSNKVAKQYIDGIGVHWYLNKISPASVLSKTHEKYPNKFILATEACVRNEIFPEEYFIGSWYRGELYANDIIENLQHWATGWIDFNMALDTMGGPNFIKKLNYFDSPIIVNGTADEFYKQPMYYVLGHFSKFAPPGSVRIDTKENNSLLKTVAFKRPDQGTAVIIFNKSLFDTPLKIKDKGNREITIEVSKQSITTILYW